MFSIIGHLDTGLSKIEGTLNTGLSEINGTFGVIQEHGTYEVYGGPYEVTPKFDAQTLETAQKLMANDVTVNAIEVHRTANPYGTTVYIGGIIDG